MDHFNLDSLETGPKNADLSVDDILAEFEFDTTGLNAARPEAVPFSAAEEMLSADDRFLTIIRGVIVNMDHILDIEKGVCFLTGGLHFPVSLRRAKQIESVWKNYIFACIRNEAVTERNNV